MKFSIVILFACVLLMNESSSAQFIRTYGAKIAYTAATQDFEYTSFNPNYDRRSGINVAAFVEWLDAPFVSVVTQLEYAQRGKSGEYWQGNELGEFTRKITLRDRVDYLSIPIVGKFRFPLGMFSPFVTAGPRVDFLLGYKTGGGYKDLVYDAFKKTNIGATVSLGSELKTPLPFAFSLEARYNFDLADSYSTNLLKVRNDSFDVWLGVGF